MSSTSLRYFVAAIFAGGVAIGAAAPSQRQSLQPPPRPRLVVLLVVDQMRADYLERYSTGFTGGLRRLMRDGAWFTRAAYPYLNTVTCAGHSTIGTGMLPYHHGMIQNSWFERKTRTSPYCTDDPAQKDISYNGLTARQGDSAKRLLVPAIGEQIRARERGRAVALSLKPRSAIPLVGHSADAVIWFDDRGGWLTSSAFSARPIPFLQQFINANPITADYDKVWNRTLEPPAYLYEDDALAERPTAGMTRTFPHPLRVAGGKPDADFYTRWQRSPFADEYLERMAEAAVDALQLGRGNTSDFLGVSFSALDAVGHVFGPRSHEVQDLLVRLDLTIGRLLDHLDRQVGAGSYVLGLSADHGVADIPEEVRAGGRLVGTQVTAALQKALQPMLGNGTHVLATVYTDIYISPAALKRLRQDKKLMTVATDALLAIPGICCVFRGDELASAAARTSTDLVRRAAALSYYPGRSGDLVIVPRENWLFSSAATTHGSQHPYDQRVPVILFGAPFKGARYSQDATPADLTPTLAAVAHIAIRPTDGRVLTEALIK